MKKALATFAALAFTAAPAFAQNAPMTPGPTNPPPGTSYSGTQDPNLPPSTTGTAKPNALNNHATAEEAATRYKFEQAGFHDVKGLARNPDGTWSGRAVRDGVEVAVSMDPAGHIAVE
ncbi:MAG TPA: hypothetical protein VFB13_05550 [Reyranella sp.]|nr:hypothetical protein [Reyranella sp.]